MSQPRARYVTHRDLRDHHDHNVKPSLDKIEAVHRALLGGLDDKGTHHEGALNRLKGVEKAQKTATHGLWIGLTATVSVAVKSLWDALRGSGH